MDAVKLIAKRWQFEIIGSSLFYVGRLKFNFPATR